MEEIRVAREGVNRGTHRVDPFPTEPAAATDSPADSIPLAALAPALAFFRRLALASTEAEVIEAIVSQGVAVIGAGFAALALLREDSSQLRLVGVSNQSIDMLSRRPVIPLSAPVPLAQVAESGVPLWFVRPEDLVVRFPAVAAEVPAQDCSLAYLPLHEDERCIGVLALRFVPTRAFELDERDNIQRAVALFSAALRRVRSLEHINALERRHEEALAIVAHELRNPVTAIHGYLQLLEHHLAHDPIERERALDSVQEVLAQTRRLEQLVASLLDRSRIQQGLLALEIVPCELSALVRGCVKRFMASSEWTANHELVLDLAPELRGSWDPIRIEQVVTNLLSNAVKYSPAGGCITVSTRALGDLVELTVADEGVSIAHEEQAQLFEPFTRSEALARQVPGIGLGLHIVATIVQRHQGVIAVESKPGEGTTVTVLLPQSPLRSLLS